MINRLLEHARNLGCSDIHIMSGEPPIVRLRGELTRIGDLNPYTSEEIRCIASDMMRVSVGDPDPDRDSQFCYITPMGNRQRVNIYHSQGRCSIAVRLLQPTVPTMEAFHLPAVLRSVAKYRSGLVLINGEAGSGRTTTVTALLNLINEKKGSHILILESPVEYIHEGKRSLISHRSVGTDVESLAQGVEAALKEDVDILSLGELTDAASIDAALAAAQAGCLVFASLRADSTQAAFSRILRAYPAQDRSVVLRQLSRCLRAVTTQCLLPVAGGDSLVPAFEILRVNDEVASRIALDRLDEIRPLMREDSSLGMSTMEQSLAELVNSQTVTKEWAQYFSLQPQELAEYLK